LVVVEPAPEGETRWKRKEKKRKGVEKEMAAGM